MTFRVDQLLTNPDNPEFRIEVMAKKDWKQPMI